MSTANHVVLKFVVTAEKNILRSLETTGLVVQHVVITQPKNLNKSSFVDKYYLRIELDGLPKTTNRLRTISWRKSHTLAKIWKRDVWLHSWHKRPKLPLQKAKLILTRCSSTRPDFDGLVSSFKCVIDGLTEAKVIAGDSHDHIGVPEYSWKVAKQKQGKIIVEVFEI